MTHQPVDLPPAQTIILITQRLDGIIRTLNREIPRHRHLRLVYEEEYLCHVYEDDDGTLVMYLAG